MKTNIKTKAHVYRLFLIAIVSIIPFTGLFSQHNFAANTNGYDTARIYHAMAKARSGGDITVVGLGGSITQGYAATTESKRWINLVYQWWENTFPSANVELVNAGWGGTGSAIGVHRLTDDVLSYDPDFVVVEFSVNDSEGEEAEKMMEGIVQQLLTDPNHPGVMLLFLKESNGTTAQASHKPVGEYYEVPMISFADLIDAQVALDGIALDDIYVDGLHPIDIGMQYIADFITGELDTIYSHLPDDIDLPAINDVLPTPPLVTDIYSHTYMYDYSGIVPDSTSGWEVTNPYWTADEVGDEIIFTVDGNAISVLYTRDDIAERGQVEAWVDNGTHTVLDAYWEETWGTGTVFALIGENLADGEHKLHIKVIDSNSPGSTGHYFELRNVLKAGNYLSPSPIAVIEDVPGSLVDFSIVLDGTSSYDPDSETPLTFDWSIVSQPGGSIATINDYDSSVANFVPDAGGDYVIGLVVNDGITNSVMGTKTIHVRETNNVPVAMAGNDTTIATGAYVELNGNNSSDGDDDELTFSWQVVSQPAGSSPTLLYATTAEPLFNAVQEGDYEIGLTVNDGFVDSEEDIMVITAIEGYTALDENSIQSLQVYPNPADEALYVNFTLKNADAVSISIYNILGVKLYTVVNEKKLPGTYSIEIPLKDQNLEPGSYLLKLNTGNQEKTVSFIVR